MFAFAQCLCHDRATTGTDHEAECGHTHHERHNQIDCSECCLADIVRYEQPIDDTVDGSEDHHDDGRQDEAQQLLISKMFG